ncbi:MAG: ATP-binding cassette domain-containing protein [Alphaproteobacteria bacterium]
MTAQHSLNLSKVCIKDAKQTYIHDLSLNVTGGEILSLMGPSGSGKSTLLAYIAGFLSRHFTASGDISIDDVTLLNQPAEQRRVGLLFQDDLLLPHLSVGQNLAFGIRTHTPDGQKRSKVDRNNLIAHALQSAGLEEFTNRRPTTLSGGQRARIALLRTLLSEPHVLLLDEPFSKLDTNLRQHFRKFVYDEVQKRGLPTLMVTHDLEDALAMKGPILELGVKGSINHVETSTLQSNPEAETS